MNLLFQYSKHYWKLFAAALLLAAINQVFSLLDPLIFRHVIDSYATKYHQYTQAQFIRGAGLLVLAAVGVAFVSRVAKNFQDYFVNVIVQQAGRENVFGWHSAIRWICPIRSLRISAAARRWANCRKFAATWSGLSLLRSTCSSFRSSA